MKFVSSLMLLLFLSLPAFADFLTCTLESGSEYKSVTVNLTSAQAAADGEYSEGVYDLSFHLSATCQDRTCEASIIVDSAQAQDEVGSTGFEFERTTKDKRVFEELLTGSRDGRTYGIYCQYSSDT